MQPKPTNKKNKPGSTPWKFYAVLRSNIDQIKELMAQDELSLRQSARLLKIDSNFYTRIEHYVRDKFPLVTQAQITGDWSKVEDDIFKKTKGFRLLPSYQMALNYIAGRPVTPPKPNFPGRGAPPARFYANLRLHSGAIQKLEKNRKLCLSKRAARIGISEALYERLKDFITKNRAAIQRAEATSDWGEVEELVFGRIRDFRNTPSFARAYKLARLPSPIPAKEIEPVKETPKVEEEPEPQPSHLRRFVTWLLASEDPNPEITEELQSPVPVEEPTPSIPEEPAPDPAPDQETPAPQNRLTLEQVEMWIRLGRVLSDLLTLEEQEQLLRDHTPGETPPKA